MCPASGDPSNGPAPHPPDSSPGPEKEAPNLEIDSIRSGAGVTVVVRGDIDPATQAQFHAALDAAVGEAAQVDVDLRDVTFMDSTGLSVLFQAHQRAAGRGATVVVRNTSATVRRLFQITAMDRILVSDETPRQERPRNGTERRTAAEEFTVENLEDGQVIQVLLDAGALTDRWAAVESKMLALIRVRQPRELRVAFAGDDAAIPVEQLDTAREALEALGGRLVLDGSVE
jgi:anti-anti-sigma factor